MNRDSDRTEGKASQAEAALSPGKLPGVASLELRGHLLLPPPTERLLCGLCCTRHPPWLLTADHVKHRPSSVCPDQLPGTDRQRDWLIPASGVPPPCQEPGSPLYCFARTPVTRNHRPEGLNNKTYFPPLPEAGSPGSIASEAALCHSSMAVFSSIFAWSSLCMLLRPNLFF